jgi:hypothetical protein
MCYCSNPTAPIEYAGSGDCTIKPLPVSDGINTYGLYIPTIVSNIQIKGFPSNTFTGNWTIEFFVYIPSTATAGHILCTSNSSELAIWDYKYMPGSYGIQLYLDTMNPITISTNIITVQSSKKSLSANKATTADKNIWVSMIIQYDSNNSTTNYSVLITPKGGNTTNIVLSNSNQTNFGTQDVIKTLILGLPKYWQYEIGVKDVYITNLRISKIARYSNTVSSSTPSPTIIWPDNPNYKPDNNTVYFNSFNVPSTTTTNGYLLSQIVQ